MNKYIVLLRPKHWIKNLFLFAAPFFGGILFSSHTSTAAPFSFISFCLAASAVYIFNDISDMKNDSIHPIKKLRPVASGEINIIEAYVISCALAIAAIALAYQINIAFMSYLIAYFGIQTAYTLQLKHSPVADIFCISAGFVVRVLAGGAAFNIQVSSWLFLTMFMVSLVLSGGKRLAEIKLLDTDAKQHRTSLAYYSEEILDNFVLISSAAALISYSLYTIEQAADLVYTVPLVTFGLFRYILLAKQGNGDPTDAATRDLMLAACIVIWLVSIWWIRYV